MRISLFMLIIIFYSFKNYAQKKKCSSNKNQIININPIAKCAIEEWKSGKTNSKKTKKIVALKIHTKKKKKAKRSIKKLNTIKKPIKAKSDCIKTNTCKNLLTEEDKIIDTLVEDSLKSSTDNNNSSEVILFSMVEEIPLFSKCNGLLGDEKQEKCFNNQMSKHFAENFYKERALEDGISGRAFMQFIIEKDGSVSNIFVKGPKNGHLLVKEIKRVISKLPKFIPGKHKNKKTRVKYSLPLNFTRS